MNFFTRSPGLRDRLASIECLLVSIVKKVDDMARTEQELSDDLDKIAAGVASAVSEISDLETQLAAIVAGEPVSQDQLDSLTAKADGIVTALSALAPPATT